MTEVGFIGHFLFLFSLLLCCLAGFKVLHLTGSGNQGKPAGRWPLWSRIWHLCTWKCYNLKSQQECGSYWGLQGIYCDRLQRVLSFHFLVVVAHCGPEMDKLMAVVWSSLDWFSRTWRRLCGQCFDCDCEKVLKTTTQMSYPWQDFHVSMAWLF